jgi:cytochrome b subunit of formate dehydrogenase
MPVWVVLCLAALVVRYRRTGRVERQQIKWLLVATAVFAAAYIPVFLVTDFNFGPNTAFWNYLWMVAMLLIPVAIGIAILRYRLYDIDVIIRKTLLYTATTALLALLFFGSVILLQRGFEAITGQQSQLAIVLSTLAIAALFNPLRNRIQAAIDRRFYRKKYDAQQVLAQFAITARDETDMNALTAELARVVQETMEPEEVKVWLKSIRP